MVFASQDMLGDILDEQALEQVTNVACLPGIMGSSLAMPDIHWGYGFPIGGVAAMRIKDGVVSPGGIGFDINCGVRLLRTNLVEEEIRPKIKELVDAIYRNVPSGLGSEGKIRLGRGEIDDVLIKGARWAVDNGYGRIDDLETTEEGGEMADAIPARVSGRAKERGIVQLGTLGSGNHFIEVGVVDQIQEKAIAKDMGINQLGQVVVLIHCGSRGLGHQIADDYIKEMVTAVTKYNIVLPDRQLACAPLSSEEGMAYLAAMRCAANYAWTNRQCITHWVRECFNQVLGKNEDEVGLELVYDVAHNIAKMERHYLDGELINVCVHRKGATRAFPAGHPAVPTRYAHIGQPVFIPGDMGRYSYVMVGTDRAMSETFGSVCHGAGRLKSRALARRQIRGDVVLKELEERGIAIRSGGLKSLAEEAPAAYKDVASVVRVAHNAGISKMVARTKPVGVIKG